MERTRFSVPASIVTDVTIKAGHQDGNLLISTKNLMRLDSDDFIVPAGEVTESLLEDFARALLGDSANIRKYRVAHLAR